MPTLRATEEEVILVAGVDAAMYLRLFKFGMASRDWSCRTLADTTLLLLARL